MSTIEKIKGSVSSAPVGALAGAVVGYLVAKKLGYNKSLPVVSFIVVGLLVGSTIRYGFKS